MTVNIFDFVSMLIRTKSFAPLLNRKIVHRFLKLNNFMNSLGFISFSRNESKNKEKLLKIFCLPILGVYRYNVNMTESQKTDQVAPKLLPDVAVLLPVASTRYLASTLESISYQNFPLKKLQVVIVATGVKTNDIYKMLPSNLLNVTEIISCELKGISFSLNLGLSQVKAEFVARIDADDIMKKDRIKNQIEFLLYRKKIILYLFKNYSYFTNRSLSVPV